MTPDQLHGGLVGLTALAGLLILFAIDSLFIWVQRRKQRDFRAEIRDENLERIHAARYKRL